MQGQDRGTITLAAPCPGRPKPLTSHPAKVAWAAPQDNQPPNIPLSFKHSLLISLFLPHASSSCSVRQFLCFPFHAVGLFSTTATVCEFTVLLLCVTAIKWCCESGSRAHPYSHQCTGTSPNKDCTHEGENSDTRQWQSVSVRHCKGEQRETEKITTVR